MKPVRVLAQAEREADRAFEHYWLESPSAARGFDEELRIAYQRLAEQPQICPPYLHGTRRRFLNRYPFFVVFRERLHDIQVIAVAHASRRPGYWGQRLK